MGYLQVSLIIAILILILFVTLVIFIRFGFKRNKKWLILYLILTLISIGLSIYIYPTIWLQMVIDMQLLSLATIFSGIAAFIVVAQLSNQPSVYTNISEATRNVVICKVIKPHEPTMLTFKIINASKVTANDIVIMCLFPESINVLSINRVLLGQAK